MDLSSTLGGKIAARSGLHESTLKNVSEYWKVVDDAVFAAHPSYLACFITCSLSTLKTDAASFKLDTLPAEILERIASDTSCQDVLALSKVNRTFNRVCYSVHVFKSMIEVGNGYGDANWQCYALTNDDSTATWARYALVDSIARAERRRKGMAMYEPQLMASHRWFTRTRSSSVGRLTAGRSQVLRQEYKIACATMLLGQSTCWYQESESCFVLVPCD